MLAVDIVFLHLLASISIKTTSKLFNLIHVLKCWEVPHILEVIPWQLKVLYTKVNEKEKEIPKYHP
jgi:hypothetical protein